MNLQSLFNQAINHAECGEYQEAKLAYEKLLEIIENSRDSLSVTERFQIIRSVTFNLAQVFNKIGDYQKALEAVELGISYSPTNYGLAIAYSAKGEALCGLGQIAEGKKAFDNAVISHPVVGRLNSADSMTRLGGTQFLNLATEWIEVVVNSHTGMLNDDLYAEVWTIRGKIAARVGDYKKAKKYFEEALAVKPNYKDAELQIKLLSNK